MWHSHFVSLHFESTDKRQHGKQELLVGISSLHVCTYIENKIEVCHDLAHRYCIFAS